MLRDRGKEIELNLTRKWPLGDLRQMGYVKLTPGTYTGLLLSVLIEDSGAMLFAKLNMLGFLVKSTCFIAPTLGFQEERQMVEDENVAVVEFERFVFIDRGRHRAGMGPADQSMTNDRSCNHGMA